MFLGNYKNKEFKYNESVHSYIVFPISDYIQFNYETTFNILIKFTTFTRKQALWFALIRNNDINNNRHLS